jgi:fluoroacetyl-CoA thioesterase
MGERPRAGDRVVHEVTVTSEMTARLFDREIHPVYGTAWMVRHIEEAGRLLVEPHLGPNEDATGYELHLRHERPAAVGDSLSITARVTHVDQRTCEAEVEVLGPAGVVGRGTFVQRYVDRGRLGGPVTGGGQ